MKAYDYEAVTYDGAVYCVECLPSNVLLDDEDVTPIFASDEWDYPPVCDVCFREHDYVTILEGDA